MGQSRIKSVTESVINLIVGMVLSLTVQVYLFPVIGINLSLNKNILVMLIFTVLSFCRNYIIRRVFNKF